jgi:hypothetical protein
VTESFQEDHSKHEKDKAPYDIDAEMDKQQKYAAIKTMTFAFEQVCRRTCFSIRREKKRKILINQGHSPFSIGGLFSPGLGNVKAST